MVELAIVLVLWITMMVGWWRILSGEDIKQSMNAAVLAGLNQNNIPLYTTDLATGVVKPWDDATVNNAVLTPINAVIRNRLTKDSNISAALMASATFSCQVKLGYLQVSQPPLASKGRANGRVTLIPTTLVGVTPEEQQAITLLNNEASSYVALMRNELMFPADAKVIYKGDYLYDATQTPQVDEIYFDTSPFFAWGCVAKKTFLFINLDLKASGIFVPSRQL